MNYTPATVARLLDTNCAGDRRNFITPAIVAEVMNAQPARLGNYLVCGWPSVEQQRQIHNLALLRKCGVPCPEPREAFGYPDVLDFDSNDPRVAEHAARSGSRNGFDLDIEGGWHGFTAWGRAYAAGIDFGRFFRLDDPRPILA